MTTNSLPIRLALTVVAAFLPGDASVLVEAFLVASEDGSHLMPACRSILVIYGRHFRFGHSQAKE